MKIDLDKLPSDPELLKKMINHLAQEVGKLKNELTLLKRRRFGVSSEKLTTIQKAKLDQEIEELEQKIEDDEITTIPSNDGEKEEAKTRGKGKRKAFPEHLPREETKLDPDPICPTCQGKDFRKISDDITEILDYVPGHFKVRKIIRPRCACKQCETIVQAVPPTRPLNRGMAGAGLIAHIMVNKFCNSLPIYRQSQMFANDHGLNLERSTMTGWVGRAAIELAPMVECIREEIFSSSHIHGDDTILKVLAPGHGKTKTGRLWTYVRDYRSHGDTKTPPAICYYYSPDRKAERPRSHLEGFKGVFHADAYSGYNNIYESGDVLEVACWAHTRRKFYEAAVTAQSPGLAHEALLEIAKLYEIESRIKKDPPQKRQEVRKKEAMPIIDHLITWMKKSFKKLPQSSPTAKAMQYALNLEDALKRYIDDGKIEIDNNIAERAMRIVAIGRKNYLFAGSDDGGEFAANIYTLTETAKANNISPLEYIQTLLERLPDHKANDIQKLLPWNISAFIKQKKILHKTA